MNILTSRLSSFRTACALLRADLFTLRAVLVDKAINMSVYCASMLLVNQYLLPRFGISATYGIFTFASLVSTAGFFEVFPAIIELVSDFFTTQTILYRCTLPLSTNAVWLAKAVYYSIGVFCMGLFVVPFGMIFLGGTSVIATFNIVKFFLLLTATSFFYGSLILLGASLVPHMGALRGVWMRAIWPLWFLGGFNFSWNIVHEWSPIISYIFLLNPILYTMEGMRAAMLGQEGSLNYWLCLGMVLFYTVICMSWAIKRLNKRLDLV